MTSAIRDLLDAVAVLYYSVPVIDLDVDDEYDMLRSLVENARAEAHRRKADAVELAP